ncbi:hypothetical protein G3576_17700 [Roseomonas stagni]|uniref:RNA polymerase sigma-70 region 2 domain-containing protein n=1 Tax=Falsiroseomonas algicola TaxID=2716930 RepID=A0A6M1LNY0_9PROT|nr:hypothetical protein [Falsiroseomonas algicola]NGM21863.1 hypothetical protein [Falsiroseomonas algicola]
MAGDSIFVGDALTLREQLRAAQAGAEAPYAAALAFVAQRARSRAAAEGRPAEEAAQAALRLLHAQRHTYDPRRDPVAWVDSIIGWASRGLARQRMAGAAD